MAKQQQSDIRRWALLGAEQRLVQLGEEAAAIHRAFPELRQRGAIGRVPTPASQQVRRRKRTMSAEGRRRISEAQKARWAKQRRNSGADTGHAKGGKKR
jgi:hypothetical protein